MRREILMFLIFSVAVCLGVVHVAESDQMPSLEGTWQAKYEVQSRQGFSPAEAILVITHQKGHLFNGTVAWQYDSATGVVGDDGSQIGPRGLEKIVGIIDWDNRSITIADVGDKGLWFGELVDADTMRIIYAESGEYATVSRATFMRQPSEQAGQ